MSDDEHEEPSPVTAFLAPLELGQHHTVALLPEGSHSTMAQTGVSGPVVVDGESFSDALFASAGQG